VTPVLIGDAADARGFSLAGVEAYVCTSREQVEQCLRALGPLPAGEGGRRPGEGSLILFSASAARLIADRIAAWRRDGSGPPFVILPR
jgi:vacuolar-type H+-ATPase subunit F/Vma7